MAGKANNALEFGLLFLNWHPNISAFVIAIRAEFEFYSERCKQVRENGKSIRYLRGVFCKLPICSEFLAWKNNK
ncbi:hypothetical protein HZS_2017 [Henneguya salminicola]|nr:hypothetical protein HZS_2017 [Henneguya salminicola]